MNKIITGFTLGLLEGVLFAPDKGTATRKKIADKGNELKNQFADFIDSVADKFESFGDDEEGNVEASTEGLHAENS